MEDFTNARTLIAIPCMDFFPVQFVQSLVNLQWVGKAFCGFMSGSLVYDSRDSLAQIAVREDVDFVLWLDSDMDFKPDLMERLFADMEGRDIVSGLYFRRKPPFAPCIFNNIQDGRGFIDYPENTVTEVEACGFGCVLMRTKVLKDIIDKHGTAFTPVNRLGEDLSFCLRAKDVGYKIHCDTGIICGHVGHSVVDDRVFKQWRSAYADQD